MAPIGPVLATLIVRPSVRCARLRMQQARGPQGQSSISAIIAIENEHARQLRAESTHYPRGRDLS